MSDFQYGLVCGIFGAFGFIGIGCAIFGFADLVAQIRARRLGS